MANLTAEYSADVPSEVPCRHIVIVCIPQLVLYFKERIADPDIMIRITKAAEESESNKEDAEFTLDILENERWVIGLGLRTTMSRLTRI